MSDKLTALAFICATALAMSGMFFFPTYKKEKLGLKTKASIKDLIDSEITIQANLSYYKHIISIYVEAFNAR